MDGLPVVAMTASQAGLALNILADLPPSFRALLIKTPEMLALLALADLARQYDSYSLTIVSD